MAKTKVLFIDDDFFYRKVYQTELSDRGFEVITATDGLDGLEKATKEAPDIIILNIIMPRRNGFDVIKELRQQATTKSIPVIFFSSLAQKEDRERAKELGAQEYLVKNETTYDQMTEIIKRLLGTVNQPAPPSQNLVASNPPQS